MKKRVSHGGTSEGSGLQRIRKALAEGWTPPVAELVGFRLTKIERGTAAIELQASREHENPMGTLHGGIICDIADAAMGMAYASLLRADESSVLERTARGKGEGDQERPHMGLLECRVTDDERRLVAYATSTCMTLDGIKEQGLTRPRNDTVSA
jgi:acyl-coenzyme A thioesterase PaaI-like protein